MKNMNSLNKNQLQELLDECYMDSKFMAQLLFPEAFTATMTPLHNSLFDFIDNCPAKKKLIVGTRGLGKTTTSQFLAMKKILFFDKHFIGYMSNSNTSATLSTSNIRQSLLANSRVRKLFGDVRESKIEGVEEKWAQASWVANGNTIVVPRGAGQQVRGLMWNFHRPDLWIIDDLEDDKALQNEERRNALRIWFEGALLYTKQMFEELGDTCEFIYIDTMKHQDSIVVHLMEDPDWEVLTLPVCDDNYKALAPTFVSQESIDKEVANHRQKGTLDVFARERQCKPVSKENASFRPSMFKYYEETEPEFIDNVKPSLVNFLIWDPAKTKNPKNAQTGFVVWGVDFYRNAFYARLAMGFYLSPREMHEKVFEFYYQFQLDFVAVEKTGLGEHITHPFLDACMMNNLPQLASTLLELEARKGRGELAGEEGGKDGRIASLLPYYEQGLIYHNSANCGALESQLMSFPNARLKDISDAAGYLPQVLSYGRRFLRPKMNVIGRDEAIPTRQPLKRRVFN